MKRNSYCNSFPSKASSVELGTANETEESAVNLVRRVIISIANEVRIPQSSSAPINSFNGPSDDPNYWLPLPTTMRTPTTSTTTMTTTTAAPTNQCEEGQQLIAAYVGGLILIVESTQKLVTQAAADESAAQMAIAGGLSDIAMATKSLGDNLAQIFAILPEDAQEFLDDEIAPEMMCIAPLSPLVKAILKLVIDALKALI